VILGAESLQKALLLSSKSIIGHEMMHTPFDGNRDENDEVESPRLGGMIIGCKRQNTT
jgi:hypothetical protein